MHMWNPRIATSLNSPLSQLESTITRCHCSLYIIVDTLHSTPASMSQNNQQSFRSQLSSFRWANSVQDDSTPVAQQGNNVFSRTWTGLSGYIPLRNEGRSQEEEAYFALSVRLISHSSKLAGRMAADGLEMGEIPWVLGLLCGGSCLFRSSIPLFANT